MKSRRNRIFSIIAVISAALFAVLVGAGPLRAQTSEIVQRLPSHTVAFVEWRGASAMTSAAQQNHMMQLLGDPAMAPLWLGIAANIQKSEQDGRASAPPLRLPEIASLVQNPAAAGIIEMPHADEGARSGKNAPPVAMFLVYEATGKSQIIEKWETATDTRGPKPPVVTHFDFNGTSVEARANDKGMTYLAMAGHYFVVSDQKSVIEQLIAGFSSTGAPGDSLAQRPEFAEVQKFIGGDAAFDFFARMPNLKQWIPANAKDKNQDALKFVNGLRLEKVHAMGGAVSFAGEAMHVRSAILGNTLPVGPLDLAGGSGTSFSTMAIAGGAPEFNVSRINFGAVYRLIMGAATAVMPEQQAASMQAAQSAAQGFLGMSIPDALDLFTGELASSSSFSDDGTQQRVFAATIQKPDEVLHILRAVAGPMTLAEDSFGNATMLDIAYPYRDAATGLQRRKMYYVAVTPQMLLVAPRKAMLRDMLENVSSSGKTAATASKGVFADPEYAKLRALLPEKLSGLGADDISQIPWDALWSNFEQQVQQSAKQAPHVSNAAYFPDFGWMKLVNPDVIPRHLHLAVSGWWKDTNGVYFESYVQ